MTQGPPQVRQVGRVQGKSIFLRNVQLEDAPFILSLRLDPHKSRYVSPVDPDVEKQRTWIGQYLASQGQAYFIICDLAGEALGTVRIYDAVGESFSWGSWMMKQGAPAAAAIESAGLVYRLATEVWGFRAAHFQVHRANTSVVAFHEKFGAQRVWETDGEIGYSIGLDAIGQSLRRYARYLPQRLLVE